MEHEEAIRLQAAERYVARELSPSERDDFEAHFFDCTDCAEDVRFELTFRANMGAVLREPAAENDASREASSVPGRRRWRNWLRAHPALALSYAANAALAAALAVFVIGLPRQTANARLVPVYFAPGPAHGADEVHVLSAGDTVYTVRFPAPAQKVAGYFYEIRDEAGKRERAGMLAASEAEESLYLQVPLEKLAAGVHTLEIRAGGAQGDIVSRSRFRNQP